MKSKIKHLLYHKASKIVIASTLLLLALWLADVQEVVGRLISFPLTNLGGILLLMFANLWFVSLRFWRILLHFSYQVSFSFASRATLAGYLGGMLVISLLGQVFGRQTVLREASISPVVNTLMAVYERILLFVISGATALLAATYLLGQSIAGEFFNRVPLFEIFTIIALSLMASLKIGGTGFEIDMLRRILIARNFPHVLIICLLTAAGQLLILASFVIAILTLQPETHILSAFAAAALISFIASIPISVNGWGVREIASVFVLGRLGIGPEEAITVSILIGICSTLVIVGSAPFIFCKSPAPQVSINGIVSAHVIPNIEKAGAWLLSMAVVLLVFFQVHMTLNEGLININLADPFAILSLTAVILHCLTQRGAPKWRLPDFNRMLTAFSTMLAIGFAIGAARFGVTEWALVGRLLGWFVLLGYLCAGYLLVSYAGDKGLRRMMETLSIIVVIIVLWQAINRTLATWGYEVGSLPHNFEAYSGNRTAFAFQLLAVMALLLAYVPFFSRTRPRWLSLKRCSFQTMTLAILLVGIVWTASRAGLLTGGILLIAALMSRVLKLGQLIQAALFAGLLWTVFELAPILPTLFSSVGSLGHNEVQGQFSGEGSNNERWMTWVYAVQLWYESPIWGAGLGAFRDKSIEWFGHFQVIHSTPLWLLAEFGIMGAAIGIWSAYKLLAYAKLAIFRPAAKHRLALLFLLLVFAAFSLAHEIFFQRIMWLMLGALLALPGASAQAGGTHER